MGENLSRLKEDIQHYVCQADELDKTRSEIVGRIIDVAQREIVPELANHLPEGYTIDSEQTCVSEEKPPISKERGFRLEIRLKYQGEQIVGMPHELAALREINDNLALIRERGAKKLGLLEIYLFGEPEYL